MAYQFISGSALSPMCGLGWKSLGVLELTALPSIKEEHWVPMVQEADVLLVGAAMPCICATGCGNPDWRTSCRRCGARRSAWAVSAGSMVVTPNFGEALRRRFAASRRQVIARRRRQSVGTGRFFVVPAPGSREIPQNSLANAERWAAGIPVPTYAIDDQSAIKVTDGAVEVVTEGHWKLFTL